MDRVKRIPLDGGYDAAQICLNGHVITDSYYGDNYRSQNFCEECGAETIIKCQSCDKEIRGHYKDDMPGAYTAPSYCHNCGGPYPWTESKIKAAKFFIDELEKLSKKDKDILKNSFEDLVKDTPNAVPAAIKFKKIISKTGSLAFKFYNEYSDIINKKALEILEGTF